MKKINLIMLSLMAMLIISCASAPSLTAPGVRISYYPQPAVLNGIFGNTQDENPYFEPSSLLRKRPFEFIILRLDLALEQESRVDIIAQAIDEGLGPVAALKTIDEMRIFWEDWPTNPQLNSQRAKILSQTYIPDFNFTAAKGKRSYYFVLMGKNPIMRASLIKGRVQVEGMPVKTFEMQLPERSQKVPVEAVLQ